MQASSPVSASTSIAYPQNIAGTSTTNNAALTIDPAVLLGGSPRPSASTSASTSADSNNINSSITTGSSSSSNAVNSSASSSIAVKQEPDDGNASSLSATQPGSSLAPRSVSAAPSHSDSRPSNGGNQRSKDTENIETIDVKRQTDLDAVSLVDQLLHNDHKAILRPDLSAFVDARDALRRLLPYHVWNIPHHDLLTALNLKEDPVLSEVRSRKRRRIAHLDHRKAAAATTGSVSAEASAEDRSPQVKVDADRGDVQMDQAEANSENTLSRLRIVDDGLDELGLPIPMPEVPQPAFPTLDFTASVFARRDALASRFRRTLTALDTTHKRAPNTSLSLEYLERLAYNDDREDVLARIEELKSLKAKLETLEESKQIDAEESSAKINLSFGITDEIERERERERELERIKRQQERAAAKAAKLEKEREARHRLGIFTPPPEPPTAPASSSVPAAPSPASTSAATPAPSTLLAGGAPSAASLAMATPLSGVSTPASTPGAYPFPPGATPPYAQPGPNGLPMPSPQFGPPSAYTSMPGTPFSPAPPFAAVSGAPQIGANGVTMPPGVSPMGAPTSAPFMLATTSMPGTASTPAATPSKPSSKSKPKATPAAKAVAAASAPGTPATPGTPGVTPGPTPHRGRGRPRKHPLPGTPGGPPIPVPRKKKEKPAKPPAATASAAASTSAQGAATAMSPPAFLPGGATSASPVPPTMPGPAPGYSGEMFTSTLPPTPTSVRPPAGSPPSSAASPMMIRPPTMHPTLTSATSLNTPRATPPTMASPLPAPATAPAKKTPAQANGTSPKQATPAASASAASAAAAAAAPAPPATNANPSIPNHPIPLLIPVASLPRLSALGIQPTPSPHIRPVIGPNGQPQGLQGPPIPIDPAQSVPAVLLGISEGTAEAGSADGLGGKQQILHISVVLSRLSPSQLSGLAVLMQSLQAQVEAGKRK